jgi:membrane-bound serine protease (ClpP class)
VPTSRAVRIALSLCSVAVAMLTAPLDALAQPTPDRTVELIRVQGVIDPPTADYIVEGLEAAQQDDIQAVILQLDTPGGLEISMRAVVQEILDSRVPVIAWVAPRGARAASAGTFIVYASHLAYMAQATEIGAATPVTLGGPASPALSRKATNDAAALITRIAAIRDRNVRWAEAAVREAASIDDSEAADLGVIDGRASSLRGLLQALDGDEVELPGSREVALETWDEVAGAPSIIVRFQDMNALEQLLHAVVSPEVAFFLLLAGVFGLVFELYNPGIGLAGIVGAVSLLLSFYGLSVLPTNWVGVLLIVVGIGLLVVDLHIAGLGVWTVGGLSALILGGLLLFAGASPELVLSPWAIAAAVGVTLLFFISVMTAALRVRLRRPVTGEDALVGRVAVAKTDIAPEGTVSTKGTLWRARTMEAGISQGAKVKVMAMEGLVLLVEPMHESAPEELTPSGEATPG